MIIRRRPRTARAARSVLAALSLLSASLSGTALGTASAAADTVRTVPMQPAFPMQLDTCRDHGAYLGTGLHRLGGGQNLVVVEVCGDPAKHSIRKVAATYLKVEGPHADGLRLHWRWADAGGTVRGGGDDDNGTFAADAQSQRFFTWNYSHPVTAQDPGARCLVGVLSQGQVQYITEPVCP
ncbi:hypothetical protein GCM10009839_30810 [Catenulispora yoronensis]|uniref:Secreted protein n=1 Tax=Catenulispora yoronensis TaxID=450799 RepID=A0ABP5FLC7_9ACTN